MSSYLAAQTTVEIRWKREIGCAECLAIMYAIESGYNTRDALIFALPQFSKNRIEAALTILFASQLVTVQVDLLILSPDAMLIDKITISPNLILPIIADEVTIPFMLSILKKLGIENPGLVLDTVFFNSKSINDVLDNN